MSEIQYPGAVPPERSRTVQLLGIRINTLEWGDPTAQPLVLCHGMWDHARSFAVLAPLLARRFRVIAIDARGHGDSDWANGYTWAADIADLLMVLRSLGRPVHLVGHSKGGGQATEAAILAPVLVTKLINIDGFGPAALPDGPETLPKRFAEFLDRRRQLAERNGWRPYAQLGDLVERRRAQNPRLTREWLRYFAFHGARETAGGWSWKSDPHMAHGFGPWHPEWIGRAYGALHTPMLAIVGSEPDTWGPLPEHILSERLSRVKKLERRTIHGTGHFVHIERPLETAEVILDFLGS
ncbi:MAG TPA: alpha/beta hydrolase [Candidatus Binatia bacterium]